MERNILLADMNSFFASVHQAIDPTIRELPVIVAGDPAKRHGIVLAASYQAKGKGVKTGMPVWQAKLACPEGIFLKPEYRLYVEFSTRILNIMREFTPQVEPFSIDEAFMDITSCLYLSDSPTEVALQLKQRIRSEVGVLCSAGLGPNKLLAKMAAGLQKPDGLTALSTEDVPVRLWPLPVRKLFGVGPRYERHLHRLNIHTIGDLARFPRELLKKRFGVVGEVLWWCANGRDSSPVNPHSLEHSKSMGQQVTLPRDYCSPELKVVIMELSEIVSRRVRQGGYVGRTVVLTLKDHNFNCLSRMLSLGEYTNLTEDIYRAGAALLEQHWSPWLRTRMVGVALTNLISLKHEQIDLFGEKEKLRRAARACDLVRDRFGEKSIKRAVSLTDAGVLL